MTADRVGTESDTGSIRIDHALHQHRRWLRCHRQSLLPSVLEQASAETGAPHRAHPVDDLRGGDKQKAVELSGKGVPAAVLVDGGGAHGQPWRGFAQVVDGGFDAGNDLGIGLESGDDIGQGFRVVAGGKDRALSR